MKPDKAQIEHALERFDSPIGRIEDDLLSRNGFAENIIQFLQSAPSNFSSVFTIFGKSGSGKTSVKNLVVEKLRAADAAKTAILEFRPWSSQNLREVLENFAAQAGRAVGLGQDHHMHQHTVTTVNSELLRQERRLLVIIDDLDRYSASELMLIFQFLGLNKECGRINYLLLMDHETVKLRLEKAAIDPEILEGTVHFNFTLPFAGETRLKSILFDGLSQTLENLVKPGDWERIESTWDASCRNLFTTLRDVKTFLHTFRFHVKSFLTDGVLELNPADLFLVEVLRKIAPRVHAAIPQVLAPLVESGDCSEAVKQAAMDDQLEIESTELLALVDLAPEHLVTETKALLVVLFPQLVEEIGGGEDIVWTRDARIAQRNFFESYFTLTIPEDTLRQSQIVKIYESMRTPETLRELLQKSFEKVGLPHLLSRLQCCHNQMQAQNTPALLAEVWRLDEIDARRAGVGGSGETRQPTQAFTRFYLRQFVSKNVRYAVASNALKSSGSVFTFATLVWTDMEKVRQNAGTSDLVFEATELNRLRQPAIEAIRKAAEEKAFLEMPDFSHLLMLWKNIESGDAVKEWYSSVKLEGRDLSKFLSSFVERSVSRRDETREVRYAVHRRTLDDLVPEYIEFEPELVKLADETLPEWEHFAVNETLKRISEKKQGVK